MQTAFERDVIKYANCSKTNDDLLVSFSQSTPETWAQYTHDNIARAEHERMASIQLRTLIENVFEDTSRDMREQCDTVNVNFQKRLVEMEDAKNKLEENLKKVSYQLPGFMLPSLTEPLFLLLSRIQVALTWKQTNEESSFLGIMCFYLYICIYE